MIFDFRGDDLTFVTETLYLLPPHTLPIKSDKEGMGLLLGSIFFKASWNVTARRMFWRGPISIV